jgi:hypothetical protein
MALGYGQGQGVEAQIEVMDKEFGLGEKHEGKRQLVALVR